MKKILKVFALLLSFVMVAGLFACDKSISNNFTIADLVDASENQQRWLADPESKLVVNPAAKDGTSVIGANGDLAVSLASGANTVNDILFFLEPSWANGGNSTDYLCRFYYTGDKAVRGLTTCQNPVLEETKISTDVPEDNSASLSCADRISIDLANDNFLVIKVDDLSVVTEGCYASVSVLLRIGTKDITVDNIVKPGVYVYNMNDIYKDSELFDETATTVDKIYIKYTLSKGSHFVISDYYAVAIDVENCKGTTPVVSEFGGFYIKSTQSFPNGTVLEVTDSIMGNSLSRSVVCTKSGSVAVAGAINGTATYDAEENVINVDCGSYKYQVDARRHRDISYFDSYEDLIANANAKSAPSSSTKYWAMAFDMIVESNAFCVSATISDTASFAEMAASNDIASATSQVKKYLKTGADRWNSFIASNDVSGYFQNIPSGK